jgi:hypothetical protein
MGQTRPFALVEPHASFTLTSRHSPRQSSRRSRAIAFAFLVFGKKSPMGGSRSSRPVPMGVVSGPHVSPVAGQATHHAVAIVTPDRNRVPRSRRMVDGDRSGPGAMVGARCLRLALHHTVDRLGRGGLTARLEVAV